MQHVLTQNRKGTENQIIAPGYPRYTTHYHRFSQQHESYYPLCYPRRPADIHHFPQFTVATRSRGHESLRWVNMHDQESTNEIGRKTSQSRSFHAVYPKNKAEKPCLQNHQQPHGCRASAGRISLRLRPQPLKSTMIEILLQ